MKAIRETDRQILRIRKDRGGSGKRKVRETLFQDGPASSTASERRVNAVHTSLDAWHSY
jgi:hypothetical protein